MNVIFVCWGNICRSPMGEFIAKKWVADAGMTGITITSAGVSSEELGNPIDPRAGRSLVSHGYAHGGHRAKKITKADIDQADLVIAAEPVHVRMMHHIAPDATNIVLLSDFDPDAAPGTPLPDPWYGDLAGFTHTVKAIEKAMPGVLQRLRELGAK